MTLACFQGSFFLSIALRMTMSFRMNRGDGDLEGLSLAGQPFGKVPEVSMRGERIAARAAM